MPENNKFGTGYRQRIREASPRVYIKKYRDYRGRVGERYILDNPPNEQGERSVTILFYPDDGDYYQFIDAPTRDLALEFEQFLISADYRGF